MKELLQLHALSHVCNYKDAFIHALTDGASGPSLISPSSTHTNLDECVSVASVCSHKHTHTHTHGGVTWDDGGMSEFLREVDQLVWRRLVKLLPWGTENRNMFSVQSQPSASTCARPSKVSCLCMKTFLNLQSQKPKPAVPLMTSAGSSESPWTPMLTHLFKLYCGNFGKSSEHLTWCQCQTKYWR